MEDIKQLELIKKRCFRMGNMSYFKYIKGNDVELLREAVRAYSCTIKAITCSLIIKNKQIVKELKIQKIKQELWKIE